MGGWDVYCSLCGLPLLTTSNNIDKPKWLYKFTILLNNNKNINNAIEKKGNIYFYAKNREYDSLTHCNPYSFIVIHVDCLKFIDKEKNIKLRYSDLPINSVLYNKKNYFNSFTFNIDYKPISKYWGQDFNIDKYIDDGHSLVTPLKNNKLGNFIINIFNKLKIKNDSICPCISAKLYNEHDLLIGKDNNIWTVSKNKWCKLNNLEKYKFSTTIDITKKNFQQLKDIYNFFEYRYVKCNFVDKKKYKFFSLYDIPRIGQVSKTGMILINIHIQVTTKVFEIKFTILHYKNNFVLDNMIKNNFGLSQ